PRPPSYGRRWWWNRASPYSDDAMVDDSDLVARLQAGDEQAFVTLVDLYHAPLLRLASTFVPSRAVAEEVVQDTWLGVVRGIHRFEGRSSLKTWLFRIVVNRARTAGVRERRETPTDRPDEPAVPPERFNAAGGWTSPPAAWSGDAEEPERPGRPAPRRSPTLTCRPA